MAKPIKFILVILVLFFIPVSAQKLKIGGRVSKPGNGLLYLECQIDEEGTYEIQSSPAITARFWSTVTNFYSLPGTFTFHDSMSGPARYFRLVRLTNSPVILQQPVGLTNLTGSEIRLTAHASGSAPLSFRWYKDNTLLNGANSTNLTFTGQYSLSGAYRFVATNPWGSATSVVANVQILSTVAPGLAGKSVRFVVTSGQGEFPATGNFTTVFNGQGYYNTAGSSPLLNDTGYWQYIPLNENTARLLLPGSVSYPDGIMTLNFQAFQQGSYNLTAPGRFGFQAGTFQILD